MHEVQQAIQAWLQDSAQHGQALTEDMMAEDAAVASRWRNRCLRVMLLPDKQGVLRTDAEVYCATCHTCTNISVAPCYISPCLYAMRQVVV